MIVIVGSRRRFFVLFTFFRVRTLWRFIMGVYEVSFDLGCFSIFALLYGPKNRGSFGRQGLRASVRRRP